MAMIAIDSGRHARVGNIGLNAAVADVSRKTRCRFLPRLFQAFGQVLLLAAGIYFAGD
jgi:hypothetical protein